MAIHNIFSKRQKRLRGEKSEVYIYDEIPQSLRVQIIHIIKDGIGFPWYINYTNTYSPSIGIYKKIRDVLRREYGVLTLTEVDFDSEYDQEIFDFFFKEKDIYKILDVVEIAFKTIDEDIRNDPDYISDAVPNQSPDESIKELNDRFKEHGIGFQYESGELIRVDSSFIHSEVVKPTLELLCNSKFKGANEEYLKAHEHYRHGRNKECLAECLKAFESTMKIICIEKEWTYNSYDTSKKLIQICLDNNLIPKYLQNQITSLRNLLETGVPTIRNKLGGHGQGQNITTANSEITRYALNLTGANIIFLVKISGIQ